MIEQGDLFGMPPLRPELSQWMTPMRLARMVATWVPNTARVLEPSAGSGNLLRALLEQGHPYELMTAVDVDRRWMEHSFQLVANYIVGNFLELDFSRYLDDPSFDVVLMNPPFEDGMHARFIARALEIAPVVIGVFPMTVEFGQERDRELWSQRAYVTRRARLPERVKYGGDETPKFETVVLRIERRTSPRAPGERLLVEEEVWNP